MHWVWIMNSKLMAIFALPLGDKRVKLASINLLHPFW